ncbi:terminase [Xenorhabdus stockiae]|uniref:Terminase n=1 Tax=Xenorhabdus stockiae TaxID=351614 RepID=A0A2D0KKK8_9GAMM|nr:terminase [Xenorhabdus stockiae]PHM63971.1 terminase [Xenorhabdus stockiae]
MARPTKYQEAYAEQARKLCLLGYTDKELADFFEVSESTLNNWKHDHPEFLESLKKGKQVADGEVAAKLFHRATGYEHAEDDIRVVEGKIVITPTVKHYPPDTTAAIFWLKNRQKDNWRDKIDHGVEGAVDVHVLPPLKKLFDDEQ